MANRQKVDDTLRMKIVKLHKQNFTVREIAETVNRAKSVIGRIVKTYEDCGRVFSPNKTGRPRKTSHRQNRAIHRIALRDRFTTAAAISREIQDTNTVDVSRSTVSRPCMR
ncbi:helix-turn-helix domain-containing protein [Solihabitans fulvus]|uniref:Helix-turn-helix domain-containing protein n=1 Tax=Solihabitans fulvus TaxID=1892852 RepID=A0A5B2VCF0_9PSEU|nr:helix-turn-helix domain-containing protein [Solihabitans fulvus]